MTDFMEARATREAAVRALDVSLGGAEFIELTIACLRWNAGEGAQHAMLYGKARNDAAGRAEFEEVTRVVLSQPCGLCGASLELRDPSEGA